LKRKNGYNVFSLILILAIAVNMLALLPTRPSQANPWYWKPEQRDYAPSGVPDFDQRQWGTYMWQDMWQQWSHCGPVAVANSLWWLDSEFEPNPMPQPIIHDGFPLVQTYNAQWDDHDPLNVPWLIEHLAYLMDTDGRRTGIAHSGTDVHDMEAGLAHYLSWTGVNPQGDVNGDGMVDQTDFNIVNAAMGSTPWQGPWDLRADIFPASTTYPPVADNVIDPGDLDLVMQNMGRTGMFYEHTVMQPDFFFIEEEVERCQDVVLLVGYWFFDPKFGTWYREPGGHYVTVAGVDSADMKLALSDPVQDAFESGLIPEGRIPVPHAPHLPPEPPYITHNDAQYVSQDIYSVAQISPPWLPPCPGGNWMLVNFASWRPAPPYFAVIESAVITSPIGIHDVVVTNVTNSKFGCVPMPCVGQNLTVRVNVTVANQGNFTETFNVTAYANSTSIASQNVTLASGNSTVVAFIWGTTGFTKGNYTISAYAWPVPGETDTADNNMTDGMVLVTLVGDVNGDRKVRVDDILAVATAFGSNWGEPKYSPNLDINDDLKIRVDDVLAAATHFGQGPW